MSVPLPGAGDFLDHPLPVAGAGNFFIAPFLGLGAGDFLLEISFSVSVVNNVIIRQQNCRLISINPIEPWADRCFVLSQDEDLCLVTPLTPGGTYAVRLMMLDPITGSDLFESDAVLEVPSSVLDHEGNIVASKLPPQFALLESLTFAFGKIIQSIGGSPSCRVAIDRSPGDTIVLVNSTLGFPRSGFMLLDGNRYEYVDKCDTAFALSQPLLFSLTAGDLLISDVKSIPPRRPQ